MVTLLKRLLIFWGPLFTVHADTPRVTLVQRDALFEQIFGCTEVVYKKDPLILPVAIQNNGDLWVQSQSGMFKSQPISCGFFKEYSIAELREATKNVISETVGKVSVREGVKTSFKSAHHHLVDVGALQANPANRDAVFQVASNFNALEAVHSLQNFEKQLISHYIYDMTQGPAASVSAFGGTLLRRYYLYFDGTKANDGLNRWGQQLDHQVNFLGNLPQLPMSRASYVEFDQVAEFPVDADYEKVKIGFHGNQQIVAGHMVTAQEQELINDPQQIIHQVFTAAIDLRITNANFKNTELIKAWAKVILNAAYEGTLRSAVMQGKKKVFLTLVGGGVFGNPLAWIGDAILSMKDFIKKSGLDVTVIWYSTNGSNQEDDLRIPLKKMVEETSGTYETLK